MKNVCRRNDHQKAVPHKSTQHLSNEIHTGHLNRNHIINDGGQCNDWSNSKSKTKKYILKSWYERKPKFEFVWMFNSPGFKWAPETHPKVWMINMTTMPNVNDDCNALGGWPFHERHPMHPRKMSKAVPNNSAKNIATLSIVLLPIFK